MITVTRYHRTPYGIFGHLRIEREIVCVTLEHPVLAIKPGAYLARLRWSDRFGMLVLGVEGVPDRSDIELHPGNTMTDTEGCILPGQYQVGDREIEQSRIAFGKVMARWREWEGQPFHVEEGA